jgi:hypothetical protein
MGTLAWFRHEVATGIRRPGPSPREYTRRAPLDCAVGASSLHRIPAYLDHPQETVR